MVHEEQTEGPRRFLGRRIHWVWMAQFPNSLQYRSVFASSEMGEVSPPVAKFGERFPPRVPVAPQESVHTDGPDRSTHTVYELTPGRPTMTAGVLDLLRELSQRVLDAERLANLRPDRLIPEALLRALAEDAVSVIYVVLPKTTEEAYIGTVQGHGVDERETRAGTAGLSNKSTDDKYSGPLFVYAVDRSLKNGHRRLERRAPVNLVWTRHNSPFGVKLGSELKRTGWTGGNHPGPGSIPQGHSHVLVRDNSEIRPSGFDDSAAKPIEDDPPFAQWHCRLFDIPETMDKTHAVAGSSHRDPIDHGLISRELEQRVPRTQSVLEYVSRRFRSLLPDEPSSLPRQIGEDILICDWHRSEARDLVTRGDWAAERRKIHVEDTTKLDQDFDGDVSILDQT